MRITQFAGIDQAEHLSISITGLLAVSAMVIHIAAIALLFHFSSSVALKSPPPVYVSLLPLGKDSAELTTRMTSIMPETTTKPVSSSSVPPKEVQRKISQPLKPVQEKKVLMTSTQSREKIDYIALPHKAANDLYSQPVKQKEQNLKEVEKQSVSLGSTHTKQNVAATDNSVGAGAVSEKGKASVSAGGGAPKSVALSQLRPKSMAKPVYSEKSIARNETGVTTVEFIVSVHGTVKSAKVVSSSGYERLDQSALRAIKTSSFYPYVDNGGPREAISQYTYHYDLQSKKRRGIGKETNSSLEPSLEGKDDTTTGGYE